MAQHGASRAWPYVDDAPEQMATALGPGAGRALVGELDLVGGGEEEEEEERKSSNSFAVISRQLLGLCT